MAHKGVRPCNLFINGALSPGHHNSTGQVIHQRWAPTRRRWMYFPVLTWMLDISKLARGATHGSGYHVEGLGRSGSPLFLSACIHDCGRETQHMQVWRVDLFAFSSNRASSHLPVSNVSRWLQPVWVTRDESSRRISSMFSPFYFSCLQVMSCLLGIKLHPYTQTGHPVHPARSVWKDFFFSTFSS